MSPDARLADLARRARGASFFALVAELERLFPDAPRVGALGPVAAEVVRFRHDVQPIFHASDVTSLRAARAHGRPRVEITTGFLGIVGSVSPLANYFTEDVLRAESLDDRSLAAFYDLFHHRFVALLYRALLRASPAAEVHAGGADRTTARSRDAAAVPTPLHARPGLAPTTWTGLAAVVGRRPRTRDALEAALAHVLPGVIVRVHDFVARDVLLPLTERAQLGVRLVDLGRDARLGRRLLRQTGLVRLAIGPVDRATFDALAPGGARHARVRDVIDHVTGGLLDAEMDVAIAVGQEPRARLGARHGTRLGSTALVARPRVERPLSVRVRFSDAGAAASAPAAVPGAAAAPRARA